MKWINASDRLPENKKWNYIFRQARNSRSATVVYLDHFPDISKLLKLPIETIEWLDETPDDKDKEIERLKALLKKQITGGCACESCVSLWNNFQDDNNL